jgi:hypothetical protein
MRYRACSDHRSRRGEGQEDHDSAVSETYSPMRRFTRLTNAFSKKAENHAHAVAIYFIHYNFVRIHQTLRVTPAMAAGVTERLWEGSDMVKVLEDWETRQ